jgi:glucose-6-phosphate 1-dehydrogenase
MQVKQDQRKGSAASRRDAMRGDSTRFTRQDSVEAAWRVFQPLLDDPPPVHPYAPGSWGPQVADELVRRVGGWQGPWIGS